MSVIVLQISRPLAVVLLSLIRCLVCFPLVVGVLCLFCNNLEEGERERELVALLLLSYGCLVTVNVL